jgi:hypothetical protein
MAGRKPFLLRLDPALFDALQRWANDEVRSLNGQIEFLLTSALREAGRTQREQGHSRAESRQAEPGRDGRGSKSSKP